MKNFIFCACKIITLCFLSSCQKYECPTPKSIVNNNDSTSTKTYTSIIGKDTYVASLSPNINYGSDSMIYTSAWTYSGVASNIYVLIQFDYSSLPANAQIASAYLNFYADTTHAFSGSPSPAIGHYGTNDSTYIKRVTSSWNDKIVTWNTKPTETSSNMILFGPTTKNTENFLNIDVTQLVKDQIQFGNYGFEFGLTTYVPYKRVVFYSSDEIISSKRPKLVINYK